MRLSDSELQVINASASHTQPTDSPPSIAAVCVCVCVNVCVCVCVCGKEREIPGLGGPKTVGRERQTHLDMARMDRYSYVCVCVRESSKICLVCTLRYLSVYSMCVCVSAWGYRSGWGLVQSVCQRSRPRLDLAKAQINTNMNSSFLPVFPRIANTHLWCGSEGEPPYTAYSVPAGWDVCVCVCVFLHKHAFLYNLKYTSQFLDSLKFSSVQFSAPELYATFCVWSFSSCIFSPILPVLHFYRFLKPQT